MDRRIAKTKAAIKDAFMHLRANKGLEKITVKELCETADINKSTFYVHYKDIYDLSNQLTSDIISKIFENLPKDTPYSFMNPELFTTELTLAFDRNRTELQILFSGNQSVRFSSILEAEIKKAIFKSYPDLRDNSELNILLSYCIHGAYNAQMSNPDVPMETLLAVLSKITQTLQPLFVQN